MSSPQLSWSQRIENSLEAQREAFTMTLYMAIVVLSVQVINEPNESTWGDVRLIVGTSVGILLAHLLAFRLSGAFFAAPADSDDDGERLAELEVSTWAVIRAATLVVVLAVVPYLMIEAPWASTVSTVILSVIIGGSAYVVGRAYGRTTMRSWMYAAAVTVLALGIAVVKAILSH